MSGLLDLWRVVTTASVPHSIDHVQVWRWSSEHSCQRVRHSYSQLRRLHGKSHEKNMIILAAVLY